MRSVTYCSGARNVTSHIASTGSPCPLKYALPTLLTGDRLLSGYDLLHYFDGSVGFVWHATHPQVYRELDKLRREGLVANELVVQSGRPNKKVYSITEQGMARAARVGRDPDPAPADEGRPAGPGLLLRPDRPGYRRRSPRRASHTARGATGALSRAHEAGRGLIGRRVSYRVSARPPVRHHASGDVSAMVRLGDEVPSALAARPRSREGDRPPQGPALPWFATRRPAPVPLRPCIRPWAYSSSASAAASASASRVARIRGDTRR